MAVSLVGTAVGTTSVTLPAHQVGDLIVLFIYRDGSTTAPTNPGFVFDVVATASGNTNVAQLAVAVATSTSMTTGTWTNATEMGAWVFRGTNPGLAKTAGATGASTTIGWPALTLEDTGNTSWVLGGAGHRSTNTTVNAAPTGMTNHNSTTNLGEIGIHSTNGTVTSWSATNQSVGGTSSGWACLVAEVRELEATNWTFVGMGTQNVVASGNVVPGEPAGVQSGDLLVACISARGNAGFSLPSGWTLVGSEQNSGNTDVNLTTSIASGLMAYIVRGGSAPSYTFTRTGGDLGIGRVFAYRHASFTQFGVSGSNTETMAAAGTAIAATGFTPTQNDSLLVFALAGARSMGASQFFAATTPVGRSGFGAGITANPTEHWQERHDEGWTTGADGSMAVYDAVLETASATGAITGSAGLSARHALLTGAFYGFDANASVSVTGLAATGSVGTASMVGNVSNSVTGLGSTGSVGSVTNVTQQILVQTGLAGAGQVGNASAFTPDETVFVTGLAGTGQVGSATASIPVSISVTGLSATGGVGGVSVPQAVSQAVTGLAASGAAGTVTVSTAIPAGQFQRKGGSASGALAQKAADYYRTLDERERSHEAQKRERLNAKQDNTPSPSGRVLTSPRPKAKGRAAGVTAFDLPPAPPPLGSDMMELGDFGLVPMVPAEVVMPRDTEQDALTILLLSA